MVILVGYVQMAEERQLKALVIRIYNYDNMLVKWNQNRLRYLCFDIKEVWGGIVYIVMKLLAICSFVYSFNLKDRKSVV